MVGGTTYEEAKTIAKMNADAGPSGARILLGGTCIHNSSSFLYQLQSAASTVVGGATSVPVPVINPDAAGTPSLNMQLGGIQVSVGGSGGTGVYRTTGGESGINVQADGIRDGVMNLFGKVKQGVEQGLSRSTQ